jgi:hypothetical protein
MVTRPAPPPAPSPDLVQGQANADREEPRPRIAAGEPTPVFIGLEKGRLGEVLGFLVIAHDESQPPNQVIVVLANGGLEGRSLGKWRNGLGQVRFHQLDNS